MGYTDLFVCVTSVMTFSAKASAESPWQKMVKELANSSDWNGFKLNNQIFGKGDDISLEPQLKALIRLD